jgi:hypothetical protein
MPVKYFAPKVTVKLCIIENYDSSHIKTQCFTIAIVSFFEFSELKVTMIDWCLTQYFSYIMATSFSGERSRRGPPTTGKQLPNC